MSNFKVASKMKLRFTTPQGVLTVEQLWDLSFVTLTNLIKGVKKILKKNDDDELSFLEESKVIDVENQLRFDILKEIYLAKKEESDNARNEIQKKEHNQKILALITQKKEAKLADLSVEELEAQLIK